GESLALQMPPLPPSRCPQSGTAADPRAPSTDPDPDAQTSMHESGRSCHLRNEILARRSDLVLYDPGWCAVCKSADGIETDSSTFDSKKFGVTYFHFQSVGAWF